MLTAVVLGFLFGFLGSVPVAGPIAALVFARGVEGRFRSGVFIGVGGAVAEAGYAFLAFWGFSALLTQYPIVVPISRAAAAVVLTVLGIAFVRAKSSKTEATEGEGATRAKVADTVWASFVLGFGITALNPTLIATWSAGVATLYSTDLVQFTPDRAPPFGIGACVGIATWFWILIALIRRYRTRFSMATLRKVVRVVGVFLLALAAWFALRFVQFLMG